MTKREEAEQAMRLGPKYATEEARVSLLREAINEALEEAVIAINAAKGNMSAWRASRIIRALKKEGP